MYVCMYACISYTPYICLAGSFSHPMGSGGSVILADVLLALGAFNLGGANAVALVLWNSGLLLVDHV